MHASFLKIHLSSTLSLSLPYLLSLPVSLLPSPSSPPQLESTQQQNRELEDAQQAAETITTQTETQLMTERREREEEKREKEERAWEVTRQLQELKELQVQTQSKVWRCLRRLSLSRSPFCDVVGDGRGRECSST